MTMRMTPHPGYRILWLILHAAGVVACHRFGLWGWYFGLVAFLEGVSLLRKLKGRDGSGTFSWSVWAFLAPGGWSLIPRVLLVAVWSWWFCIGFAIHGWLRFGPMYDTEVYVVNAWVAGIFLTWLWVHFFAERSKHG